MDGENNAEVAVDAADHGKTKVNDELDGRANSAVNIGCFSSMNQSQVTGHVINHIRNERRKSADESIKPVQT